jgi:hypothetical protein
MLTMAPLVQRGEVVSKHPHDVRADGVGEDVLGS